MGDCFTNWNWEDTGGYSEWPDTTPVDPGQWDYETPLEMGYGLSTQMPGSIPEWDSGGGLFSGLGNTVNKTLSDPTTYRLLGLLSNTLGDYLGSRGGGPGSYTQTSATAQDVTPKLLENEALASDILAEWAIPKELAAYLDPSLRVSPEQQAMYDALWKTDMADELMRNQALEGRAMYERALSTLSPEAIEAEAGRVWGNKFAEFGPWGFSKGRAPAESARYATADILYPARLRQQEVEQQYAQFLNELPRQQLALMAALTGMAVPQQEIARQQAMQNLANLIGLQFQLPSGYAARTGETTEKETEAQTSPWAAVLGTLGQGAVTVGTEMAKSDEQARRDAQLYAYLSKIA